MLMMKVNEMKELVRDILASEFGKNAEVRKLFKGYSRMRKGDLETCLDEFEERKSEFTGQSVKAERTEPVVEAKVEEFKETSNDQADDNSHSEKDIPMDRVEQIEEVRPMTKLEKAVAAVRAAATEEAITAALMRSQRKYLYRRTPESP